ncbi:MAG: hypothetical protein PHI63_02230 [Patescibacteria group bacterium]|nr:hypothetical protein [Patescibacteria group bacterium]
MHPTSDSVLMGDHIAVSQPAVCVEFDAAGNPTATLDEEFVAANCECSGCENNTGDDGICGNDW